MSVETKRLGQILTLKRGYDLPISARADGAVPVVSSSGITGFHNEPKIEGPGVATGRYGTIGEVFYVQEDYWPLNTALYVQDFKGHDPRFIYYYLTHILKGIQSDKAAVPGVNRNDLHAREVKIPSKSTHARIAAILSAYDDLIENNRRRIQLLEQAARLIYQEWFVRLRFPGHEHVRVVDGVPEGWERRSLGDLCRSFEDGDWVESKDQGGEDYRLLQVSNVGINQFIETGNFRYISEETFRRLKCRQVLPGDILISRMPRPVGRAWLVTPMPWRMITAVDVAIAGVDVEQVSPLLVLYYLNSPFNFQQCETHITGATRPRVTRSILRSLDLLVPSRELQHVFDQQVEPIQNQMVKLRQMNDKSRQARDLLLPKLMSGEIEV
jgi:type I restriction enzyme, S subunit